MKTMFQNTYELTEMELASVSGGVFREIFQKAVERAMDNHLLCNPDTALMDTSGKLTSDGPLCPH